MLPTSLMRRLALVALPLALAAGMAPTAAEPGVTADSLKIGILGSLTGPFAIFGSGNLAGATLAFEQANAAGGIHGRKLEWLSLDDESSPPKGIAAYKRLVGPEQVFAVFGPSASAVGQAMVQTFKTSTTPTFISVFSTPIVTDPPLPNVFRTGPMNDREQGVAIANYALDHLKAKRVALIRQSDEYGKSGGESVLQRLKARGAEPVALEVFNVYDTDFNAQLTKIAAARPDVLVVYGYPNPSAIITRQARQLGVQGVVLGSNSAGSRKYPEIVGKAAAGTQNIMTLEILPESSSTPQAQAFREAFVARFPDLARQGRPDLGGALGYGGALAFLEGIKRAGAQPTQQGLVKALESLQGFRCPPPSVPAYARATAPRASWRSATICRAASCPSWSASMA
ncbi:putative branched-chain amino acid-binding protein [Bordetella pertussis]|uniref:ABC transporter substrate-binding protein n=1 Tax=Bordetella pertussis TaxID=520 RepID=UPI0005E38C30|nr:ABC transporter substrate-binding protein [Bordetella pertussis]UEB57542.1 ABC transporter substrate-binding protein [Bordetella pertussis]CFP52848.1 putative branched-chain amino acid-binding protein [Bordetella pertussis]CPJ39007.1 putative branched-chain amino acid-binding protein [Bordetella pertussis]CPM83577.1 putative branched-chain amino acid-binding protein [Bordetella pertussis]CPN47784.1 putative branched-chain amino acid-binding protein [Bordetella pertussis]